MKFLHRNRRPSKRGSSLPMVMAIGAALVIWVMALLPLMATSGTTAAQTKAMEASYLSNRSSIEFVKGELTDMVKSGPPKTFAVVVDNSGNYSAVPKYTASNTVDSAYSAIVDTSANPNNKKDSTDTAKSDSVVAICGVEHTAGSSVYDITIRTYDKGEEGMTYAATYTVAGNLKIFPEAYKQVDALPLSDFVLVDGKLGAKEVWKSTIENKSDKSFNEYLLPETVEGADAEGYADAGEYPAVFKKTAEAIMKDSEDVDIPEGAKPLEDPKPQNWVLPTSSDFVLDDNTHAVSIASTSPLSGKVTLTDLKATVYYNGAPAKNPPTGTGSYRVTVGVEGTGAYDAEKNINVLPAEGIEVGNYTIAAETTNINNCSVTVERAEVKTESESESENTSGTETDDTAKPKEYTYTAKFSGSGVTFGYCTGKNPVSSVSEAFSRITWGVGDFELKKGETYYFYCVANGSISDGVIKEATIIKYLGVQYVPTEEQDAEADEVAKGIPFTKINNVNQLQRGKSYLICKTTNSSNGTYVVLRAEKSGNSNSKLKVDKIQTSKDSDNIERLSDEVLGNLSAWTYTKASYGSYQTLQSGNQYLRLYKQGSWSSSYYATLTTNSNDAKLSIITDDNYIKIRNSSNNTYLKLNSDDASAQSSGTNTSVFFVEIPTRSSSGIPVPTPGSDITITSEDLEYTYGDITEGQVAQAILGNVPSAGAIYLNGSQISADSDEVLQSGSYLVHVTVSNSYRYVPAGTVTVSPVTYSLSGSVSVSNKNSSNQITNYKAELAYTNWSESGSPLQYYGYTDSNNTTHWSDSATIENLPVGKYTFVVKQGNTNNHVCSNTASSGNSKIEVVHPYWTADEGDYAKFIYTVDAAGNVSWYKLPEDLLYPSRVTLCSKGKTYVTGAKYWDYGYYENAEKYGVEIVNSDYYIDPGISNRDDNPLVINLPSVPEVVGNYYSSVISGDSIYFMGDGAGIHTHGADVTINTDLLVLRNGIDGIRYNDEAARYNTVTVNPHDNESGDTHTLMFVVNGFSTTNTTYENRTFYLVKKGTDLAGATIAAAGEADPSVRKVGVIVDGALPGEVRDFFSNGDYPVLIADVAYANTAQLSQVINSEVMGWTNKGVWTGVSGLTYRSGTSSTFNGEYAVCAYVTEVGSGINYSANRIMIATPASEGYNLAVTNKITLQSRYVSIEAATMTGSEFIVNVLEEADSALEKWLDQLLGSNYNSKTLQVEFERETVMPAKTMPADVFRYKHGSNLFTSATASEGDMVEEYEASNVNDALSNSIADYISDTEIQERYIRFKGDGDDSIRVNTSFWFLNNNLYVYTNFLEFDGVSEVQIGRSNNFYLNTQEKGYDDEEYLGFFKDSSAESYHGVMIHCKNAVTVNKNGTTYTIPRGMFFVKSADCGNLVTIAQKIAADETAAAQAAANGQPYTYQYRIDEEWLRENAAYIGIDGEILNSYVDSDILGGGGGGTAHTGFAGGGVK